MVLGILQKRCQPGGTVERLKLTEIDRLLLRHEARFL